MIGSLIAIFLAGAGIILLLDVDPEQVTQALMKLLTPHDSLRERAAQSRGHRVRHRLYFGLVRLNAALTATGKSKQFSWVCSGALLGILLGIAAAFMINNVFMLPVLVAAFTLAPFLFVIRMLNEYDRRTREEMETTLSLVTVSYLRTENILQAVQENLPYIRHPMYGVFQSFLQEATVVTSSMKQAIGHMRDQVDDDVFREWCDILILCQDDRTLKDMLPPTAAKLTDMRLVNDELNTLVSAARREYWTMACLLVGSVPLMYFMLPDFFTVLVTETAGKIVCSICGGVLLVTSILAERFTRPVKFRK